MKQKKLIAYLIQAHHQPEHFMDLVNQLNHKDVHFFVHVDKKSDQELFTKTVQHLTNIQFVQKRKNVFWGGFSQVQATLEMMQLALNSSYDFKYFVLLSGVCYPIKSKQYIINFFQQNSDNYFDIKTAEEKYQKYKYLYSLIIYLLVHKIKKHKKIYRIHKKKKYYYTINFLKKIIFLLTFNKPRYYISFGKKHTQIARSHYWFLDNFFKIKRKDKKYPCLAEHFRRLFFFLNWVLPVKKSPKNIKIFCYGNAHFSLRQESIAVIVRFFQDKKNKDAIFFYKFSSCSDERIFHTILENTKENLKYRIRRHNLHHIPIDLKTNQWPKILNEEDYYNLKKSPKLFARKFDFQKSKKLKHALTKID